MLAEKIVPTKKPNPTAKSLDAINAIEFIKRTQIHI